MTEWIWFFAICYFLPALIAWQREHHNAAAIAFVTLFLGWTGICWLIAMVWSLTAVRREC